MGRYLKNTSIATGSYAIRLPLGTDSLGPQYPAPGQMRFNTTADRLEVFYGGAWKNVGLAGRVSIVKDSFFGDAIQTTFTMTQQYAAGHEAEMLVFIGNVFQNPGVAYTVGIDGLGNGIITFTSVPDLGIPIVVLHNFNSTAIQ